MNEYTTTTSKTEGKEKGARGTELAASEPYRLQHSLQPAGQGQMDLQAVKPIVFVIWAA